MLAGKAVDYCSYTVNPGKADIFFPVDFDGLKRLYSVAAATSSNTTKVSKDTPVVVSNVSDFMYTFADWRATTTVSGFNPLLEDFTNTKILLGNMTSRIRKHGMR